MIKIITLISTIYLCFCLNACQSGQNKSGPDSATQEMVAAKDAIILNENGVTTDYALLTPPVGLYMKIAVDYDADEEEIGKIKQGIERFSSLLWNDTWGNMYIEKVFLTDKTKGGYVILQQLPRGQGGHARYGGFFVVSTNLLNISKEKPDMGIRIFAAGLLHEFNHSMFHLPDEYPYNKDPNVPNKKCVMDPRSKTTVLCVDCEKIILSRFKNWKFPSSDERTGWGDIHKAPKTFFVINNN